MRFYKQQHKYFCGVDLHARKMYVCIVDQNGKTKIHQNIKTDPDLFLKLISRYRKNVVVGVESIFPPPKRRDLRLAMAGRPVHRKSYPFRPWSCIVHEGHSWRQNKKR
jgi:hypothetical protein